MDMLKLAMQKLTPIAAVQGGLGLDDRSMVNLGSEVYMQAEV